MYIYTTAYMLELETGSFNIFSVKIFRQTIQASEDSDQTAHLRRLIPALTR